MDLERTGERIRRERERAGFTERQLADRAGLSQSTLHRIEHGTRAAVTLAEIDRIAEALEIPLRLITSGNPVRERVQIAARINTLVEADREEALRQSLQILELDARLDRAGPAPDEQRQQRRPAGVPLPQASRSPELQGKDLAAAVRLTLDLGTAPIADIDELIEQLTGVDTAVVQLPKTVDGFTLTDPVRRTTLVAVRACEVPERQRFTFGHELGHLLLEDGTAEHQIGDERSPAEERCNAFARHLLAPEDGILSWLGTRPNPVIDAEKHPCGERVVALMARHFRVSLAVVLIQIEHMGLISASLKKSLKGPSGAELAQRYGWGPAYEQEQSAANTVRPPRRILERAILAYRENRIGIRALAGLEGRSIHETEAALKEAGITVTPPATRRADLGRLLAHGSAGRQSGQ
ncbi:helix-turn-helix domain-containing protein [Kitasatospora sp. NPDC057223]|uniref:helix-turn-helix domain-containing protein n=1 Tax=Kitasatospora sp. NPDC057223 TaxID=3346055 RepID=UPI00362E9B6D